MSEQWKPVEGHEESYEVSDRGRVRSLDREVLYSDGRRARRRGRVLKPRSDSSGYYQVGLYRDGKERMALVHHLVAAAYIGPRPEGYEVNHIDGDRTNNRAENLEYVTPDENRQHAIENGLAQFDYESHPLVKLTERDVRSILAEAAAGTPRHELAHRYGVNASTISKIALGKRWPHVYEQFCSRGKDNA